MSINEEYILKYAREQFEYHTKKAKYWELVVNASNKSITTVEKNINIQSKQSKQLQLEKFINDSTQEFITIAQLINEFVTDKKIYKNRYALNASLHDLKKQNRVRHVNTGIYAKTSKDQEFNKFNILKGKRNILFELLKSNPHIKFSALTEQLVGINKIFKTSNALKCAIYDLKKSNKISVSKTGLFEIKIL